jgi:hypothetical protein
MNLNLARLSVFSTFWSAWTRMSSIRRFIVILMLGAAQFADAQTNGFATFGFMRRVA